MDLLAPESMPLIGVDAEMPKYTENHSEETRLQYWGLVAAIGVAALALITVEKLNPVNVLRALSHKTKGK